MKTEKPSNESYADTPPARMCAKGLFSWLLFIRPRGDDTNSKCSYALVCLFSCEL